jgi:hypothetical protein
VFLLFVIDAGIGRPLDDTSGMDEWMQAGFYSLPASGQPHRATHRDTVP